ncbi:DUF6261 family protein [Parasediminibacterium paludis]|uniref:DUF6261 family protein n=1 Tax=Parasediminibacterium paludis TaxID=908966 RepID=A0ABV8PY61_9BACT
MIAAIDVKKLRNPEYLQFSKDMLQIINNSGPAALQVVAPYNAFATITTEIDNYYKIAQGSEITAEMLLIDERRDKALVGISKMVDSMTYYFDEAKQAAATTLSKALELYGKGIAKQNYQAETETITSMVRDLTTKPNLVAAVTKLGLTDWVTEMQTANSLFNTTFIARAEELGTNKVESVSSKRAESTALYFKLRDKINAQYIINDGADPFKTAISKINSVISSYQNLITHRATKHFDISGKVTDAATGKPLTGVQVADGTNITTTDYDGKYGFAKLANGIYELTFALAGYKTAFASPKFIGTPLVVDQILEKV